MATERVLRDDAARGAAVRGERRLRRRCANGSPAHMAEQGLRSTPSQVLITTGSQQGLDLVGKVLIDAGSRIAVESPTYLGALQAFAPYEPEFVSVDCDDEGPMPDGACRRRAGARFLYLLPNFQNPSGRCIGAARRAELSRGRRRRSACRWSRTTRTATSGSTRRRRRRSRRAGATARSTSARSRRCSRRACASATSIAPPRALPEAAAGQAGGRPAHAGLQPARRPRGDPRRLPARPRADDPRALQGAARCDAGRARDAPGAAAGRGCRWTTPQGGMFFWVELPEGIDATGAAAEGGRARRRLRAGRRVLCAATPKPNTLRLSFVTVAPDAIARGVAALAERSRRCVEPCAGRADRARTRVHARRNR